MTLLLYLLLVGGHYIQLRVWLHSILEDVDIHSHVLKYTEVWRILLMAAWLLASPPTTLAYSLTHSTPHGATHTTILSTTSYPYALTMVVPVMCTYVS